MTALSATVGSGNVAGVATAIYLGGPGAVFWMWMTALFGMATKYSEAVLAVRYREIDELGRHVGGPMYYIRNGLGPSWHWLAFLFSLFGTLAAFGIGNTVQANTVANAVESSFQIPTWGSGLLMAVLTGAVIIGGIRRLGSVAARLVPFMALAYMGGALIVIVGNIEEVPVALGTIMHHAFTGTAATGGFAGASVLMAIRFGVARGVFSNEAGLGSAPIAHAAAKTNDPVRQGLIAMLGTFIDTILICTMTALVIVLTGSWTTGKTGAALATHAFDLGLHQGGGVVVTLGLMVFAFTTLLGWSYYGERCAEYLLGIRAILPFRIVWVILIPIGAMGDLGWIWLVADILNGLMAVPNLIALLALSPIIFQVTRAHAVFGKASFFTKNME
jgi:AGCS family alanine or glycine:cation symporter